MSNPYKTPEFEALFQQWNDVLKKDGFKDAEDFSLPIPTLKAWHGFKWKNETDRPDDAQTYFSLAQDLLHNGFRFKNDLHRRTWELHCMGLSVRKIEQTLWSQMIGYKGKNKTNVHAVIVTIQKKAGLKRD